MTSQYISRCEAYMLEKAEIHLGQIGASLKFINQYCFISSEKYSPVNPKVLRAMEIYYERLKVQLQTILQNV